ncbi:MAG: hypothetical protein PHP75_10005, partial [Methylacidiphilaceae bacterium]|nr:hypothetical protein [Candidatus Methylacidiphilaceae bacterium]
IAEFNLIAGRRAKASTAYSSALKYLTAGRALLMADSWTQCYELSFALEILRAECEFLTGDLAAAEERMAMLSTRAGNLVDSATVAGLRVNLFTTLDRSDRSIEVTLEYLQRLGIDWSAHPFKEDVIEEFRRIWQQLGSESIEKLSELPAMSDPGWRATMDVLTTALNPAMFTDQNLLGLMVGRMVNLSLEHGNSDGSPIGYAFLGMFLGPYFGDYPAGARFAQLAIDLVEKQGFDRFKARVYLHVAGVVNPWMRHFNTSTGLIRRAFAVANETGDLGYASYSCNHLITNLLAIGAPLGEVQREAEIGLDFVRKAQFGLVTAILIGQIRLIRSLRRLQPVSSFNNEEFDEEQFERNLAEDPRLAIAECWYWIRKLQERYFAGDYASAIQAGSNAERLLWTSPSHIELAEYHFYDALARSALCDTMNAADEQAPHLAAMTNHHKQLAEWAEHCPQNFANRASLVAAEIARIEDKVLDAQGLYEKAIRSARESGFVHNEGIANELAAKVYLERGFETIARAYQREAGYCYDRWGAQGKVRQLEQRYSQLRD